MSNQKRALLRRGAIDHRAALVVLALTSAHCGVRPDKMPGDGAATSPVTSTMSITSPAPMTTSVPAAGDSGTPEIDAGATAPSAVASGGLPLITDKECVKQGGHVVTEQTYAHLNRRPRAPGEKEYRFRVCRFPSPKNGTTCRGSSECAGGHCMCTGDLARPEPRNDPKLVARDGTPATGVCSDEPLMSGTWWCLVEGGKVMLNGLIID